MNDPAIVMRSELRRLVSARRALTIVLLTVAWCAMWGSATVANVASGLVVALVALSAGVRGDTSGGVRLRPLLTLIALVSIDMVKSTAAVVREVLTPTDRTAEAIIAVPMPPGAEHHLLLLFVAITVTPGTAVVAAEADASVIYLHVLHADKRDEVVEHVQRLARVADAALPHSPSSISAAAAEVSS